MSNIIVHAPFTEVLSISSTREEERCSKVATLALVLASSRTPERRWTLVCL